MPPPATFCLNSLGLLFIPLDPSYTCWFDVCVWICVTNSTVHVVNLACQIPLLCTLMPCWTVVFSLWFVFYCNISRCRNISFLPFIVKCNIYVHMWSILYMFKLFQNADLLEKPDMSLKKRYTVTRPDVAFWMIVCWMSCFGGPTRKELFCQLATECINWQNICFCTYLSYFVTT